MLIIFLSLSLSLSLPLVPSSTLPPTSDRSLDVGLRWRQNPVQREKRGVAGGDVGACRTGRRAVVRRWLDLDAPLASGRGDQCEPRPGQARLERHVGRELRGRQLLRKDVE